MSPEHRALLDSARTALETLRPTIGSDMTDEVVYHLPKMLLPEAEVDPDLPLWAQEMSGEVSDLALEGLEWAIEEAEGDDRAALRAVMVEYRRVRGLA